MSIARRIVPARRPIANQVLRPPSRHDRPFTSPIDHSRPRRDKTARMWWGGGRCRITSYTSRRSSRIARSSSVSDRIEASPASPPPRIIGDLPCILLRKVSLDSDRSAAIRSTVMPISRRSLQTSLTESIRRERQAQSVPSQPVYAATPNSRSGNRDDVLLRMSPDTFWQRQTGPILAGSLTLRLCLGPRRVMKSSPRVLAIAKHVPVAAHVSQDTSTGRRRRTCREKP